MSFNYDPTTQLGQIRLLVADTDYTHPIFQDEEVQAAMAIESSQNLYISGMASPNGARGPVGVNVTSTLRSAAVLLDALASNKARLSGVIELLDVKLSFKDAAIQLHVQAENYRTVEANQGHFAIAEQIFDQFGARERTWKQLLRLEAGA